MKQAKFMASLLVLILLLAGCAGGTTSSSQPDEVAGISGKLTLYTSEPEELVNEMVADFNKSYPDVQIDIFRSGTGKVVSKMSAELETGSTEADIIWFADIGYVRQLDEQGLILHYSPEEASAISAEYRYNDGMAHEVRLIYNVIAYNTTKVSDPPKDWLDVTESAYNGTFAMANPNYSGGAFTALVVNVQNEDKVGWDFYTRAAENNCKYEESNGNLQTKVSSGEYSAVAIVDFMARNAKNDGSPVDVVWPESGAILVPTPIALMSTVSEESVGAAKAFIDYMYAVDTQKLFVEQGYLPVISEAGVPQGAPQVSEIVTMPFDLDYYSEHSSEIRDKYIQLFGE